MRWRPDEEAVGGRALEPLKDAVFETLAGAEEENEQEDAPEDAERGEDRAQPVGGAGRSRSPASCRGRTSAACATPRARRRSGAPRRRAGREEAGERAGEDEERGRGERRRPRSTWRVAEKLRVRNHPHEDLEQRHAEHQADVTRDRGDQYRFLEDQRDDRTRRRADRLADADLLGALLTAIIMMLETPTTPATSVPMPIDPTKSADPAHHRHHAGEVLDVVAHGQRPLVLGSKSWRSASCPRTSCADASLCGRWRRRWCT